MSQRGWKGASRRRGIGRVRIGYAEEASLCVNGGNMSAVPTRSHSPLPLAREFVRVTSPEPPTPIVGPLTLVKMLLVNVPLETDPGVPVT